MSKNIDEMSIGQLEQALNSRKKAAARKAAAAEKLAAKQAAATLKRNTTLETMRTSVHEAHIQSVQTYGENIPAELQLMLDQMDSLLQDAEFINGADPKTWEEFKGCCKRVGNVLSKVWNLPSTWSMPKFKMPSFRKAAEAEAPAE